jgi:mono/diheme cytochrome c family protein
MKRIQYISLSIFLTAISLLITGLQSCRHDSVTVSTLDSVCYTSQILPVLTASCGTTGCHDTATHASDLIATSYPSILKKLTPGDPMSSKLYTSLVGSKNSKMMPPDHPLEATSRALIQVWITQGANSSGCTPALPSDGAALYGIECSGCHHPLATSTKGGATVARIQSGINSVLVMHSLNFLTLAQLQAISDALVSIIPPPLPVSGDSLYALECASCHKPLSTSTKGGATVARINAGISTVADMKSLSILNQTQIQAIANALASIVPPPVPTSGDSLYAMYCAGCHQALAISTKGGATAAQIQTGISTVPGMKYLSTLTTTQINAIASALSTITPPPLPTDGPSLYALECAPCHGAVDTSSKIGASVARINAGISTVPAMSSLKSLTAAQILAISNTLVATPMPTDGPSLYRINCERCHHPLANSNVGGSNFGDIQDAINGVNTMKYLSTLTTLQIQTIANTLSSVPGGGGGK